MTFEEHAPEGRAGEAFAEQGVVMLDGPNGVAVSLTPDAAEATARNLHAAAQEARRQRSNDG